MVQMLITMRGELAKRYGEAKKNEEGAPIVDFEKLFEPFKSLKVIGNANYCTRVSISETEVPAFKEALGADYIIEDDFVLQAPPGGQQFRPKRLRLQRPSLG